MNTKHLFLTVATSALLTSVSLATPVSVTHQDDPNCCDFLSVPVNVDELGTNVFPPDETISASDQGSSYLSCPSKANPGVVGTQVSITNLTSRSFTDLWYVADPETTFTNIDGQVNNEHAFKIDSVGLNRPLIIESFNPNGIFEPGEQWDFVIDGYFNTFGLPASQFQSVGLVGSLSGGDSKSSGSIIATGIVPEPTSGLLATIGLCLVFARRAL